jgi:hypothetical protein
MEGPKIFVETLGHGQPSRRGGKKGWQYHSRTSVHARQVAWAVLFDLLCSSEIFRSHAQRGVIAFALDYQMGGALPKKIDVVVCRRSGVSQAGARSFENLGRDLGMVLTPSQLELLGDVRAFREEERGNVRDVVVALEAKACMTDHSGAIPRLFAEFLATGYLVRQVEPDCITAAVALVNASDRFVTPSSGAVKEHGAVGPDAVVKMVRDALPLASKNPTVGYDAVAAVVVDCRNDGSPVRLLNKDPAPRPAEHHHYEWMLNTLGDVYRSRFGHLAK